ncbi:helix-turn-helix domain-containing protein [Streptomyces poonensis]|nr:helix-turn-helix domain-containing protein [Streptomyces poonensis]
MAVRKTNAAVRPHPAVARSGSPSGVIQLKAYQPERYTIIGNHLAQHRELSLVAMGLALHILSLPDGAAVDIRTLTSRFPEGRDRIAFALRELEAHGYFERVRERTGAGQVVTRTYAHHVPGRTTRTTEPVVRDSAVREPVREQVPEPEPGRVVELEPVTVPGDEPEREAPPPGEAEPVSAPEPSEPPAEDAAPGPHHEEAVVALTRARKLDKRIMLSERDVQRLAPAAAEWIARGVGRVALMQVLSDRLPPEVHNPAALVAHRLREWLPPSLPSTADTIVVSREDRDAAPLPRQELWRDCEGDCGCVIHSSGPERMCRDCRAARTAAPDPDLVCTEVSRAIAL